MKEHEKEIRSDSPDAAQYRTDIKGWVSSDGRYFGENEQAARYAGSTHVVCECGASAEKPYTHCDDCRLKRRRERYLALPFKEWDGKEPICFYDGDEYFFDEESLIEWLYEHEWNGSDALLVICAPISYSPIDMECIAQEAYEDWEPNQKLEKLVNDFNAKLKEFPPHSWMPGKTRTSYEYTYTKED